MPRTPNPLQSPSLLQAALEGLELQKERLDAQIAHVRALIGRRGLGRPMARRAAQALSPPKPRKRKLTPEGRARIVEAAKKRWAAVKQQKAARAKKAKPLPPAAPRKSVAKSAKEPAA